MPLTDTAIRAAKAGDKPYKLAVGGGLYLLMNPTGSRLWRLKYRIEGKEKLLAIGSPMHGSIRPSSWLTSRSSRPMNCTTSTGPGLRT
ncbi:Arm DNA-binding domain-containing protein [Xanthobacter autotrophicus]|uniref:Arm DNA-binding domain-containing protein n=1 Tax=Xanthobacter autotrophicus TaxID=280 RepID=UPI0032BF86E6